MIADLPVGRNMMDHIMTDAVAITLEKNVGLVPDRIGLMDQLQYTLFGTGMYNL